MRNDHGSHELSCELVREVLANVGDGRAGRPELAAAAAAHLEACEACLEAMVVTALEQKPALDIPTDFAVRMAARAAADAAPVRAARRMDRVVSLASLAVGLAVLLALLLWVPHWWSGGTTILLAVDTLIAAEVGGVAAWVAFRGTNLADSGMSVRRFHFW
jgi:hypothetical protein